MSIVAAAEVVTAGIDVQTLGALASGFAAVLVGFLVYKQSTRATRDDTEVRREAEETNKTRLALDAFAGLVESMSADAKRKGDENDSLRGRVKSLEDAHDEDESRIKALEDAHAKMRRAQRALGQRYVLALNVLDDYGVWSAGWETWSPGPGRPPPPVPDVLHLDITDPPDLPK